MNSLFIAFAAIVSLFASLLVLKGLIRKDFCVICASVSVTWLGLLVLYWLGSFKESLLIALLMGQSVVGGYYLLEKRVPERFLAFRLPFLLSATFGAYLLVAGASEFLYPFLFLLALWLAFGALFLSRANKKAGEIFGRLLACCKKW